MHYTLQYLHKIGRSGISRGSFLTGADSTWGLSNFIVSKGYRVKRRRKAYKSVEKAKEKANTVKIITEQ